MQLKLTLLVFGVQILYHVSYGSDIRIKKPLPRLDPMFYPESEPKFSGRYSLVVRLKNGLTKEVISKIYKDSSGWYIRIDEYGRSNLRRNKIYANETKRVEYIWDDFKSGNEEFYRQNIETKAAYPYKNEWLFPAVKGKLTLYKSRPHDKKFSFLNLDNGDYEIYKRKRLKEIVSKHPELKSILKSQDRLKMLSHSLLIGGLALIGYGGYKIVTKNSPIYLIPALSGSALTLITSYTYPAPTKAEIRAVKKFNLKY